MSENVDETITITRAELDELVTRAARAAVEAEEERRREESVVYRNTVNMEPKPKKDIFSPKVREEVKRRREALGLSLPELGRLAKVSSINIQDIEEGGYIHGHILEKTLRALGEAEATSSRNVYD